jgi:hypothetical protein
MSEQLQELIDTVKKTQKEWLTPDELEAEFGILRSTQAKMRMAKTLPYHKIGKYVRYHRPDINEMFMDAKVV